MVCILGIEGSANKIGVGIIRDGAVLSNPRSTFHAPPGEGFRPAETAVHHRQNCVSLVLKALQEAKIQVIAVYLWLSFSGSQRRNRRDCLYKGARNGGSITSRSYCRKNLVSTLGKTYHSR